MVFYPGFSRIQHLTPDLQQREMQLLDGTHVCSSVRTVSNRINRHLCQNWNALFGPSGLLRLSGFLENRQWSPKGISITTTLLAMPSNCQDTSMMGLIINYIEYVSFE